MKKSIPFVFILLTSIAASCQSKNNDPDFNLDFEKVANRLPIGWNQSGNQGYTCSIDSTIKKRGKYSASIEFGGTSPEFKALSYTIPASYEGQTITLSGYIKTENVTDGFAGLWMRIDPSVAFDNMNDRGIKGTNDWQKLQLTLRLDPAKTRQIVFGGILVGKGKIWLDDLNISIDGKDIAGLKPLQLKLLPAEQDKEFKNGSNIPHIKLDDKKAEDLAILGKVWGFLKYYHPFIAAGKKNWDFELFRILPRILEANGLSERNNILSAWIDSLGRFDENTGTTKAAGSIKMEPDLSWIEHSALGDKLTGKLLSVKNAKRAAENYYIDMKPGVENPDFKNEDPYQTMAYPDDGFRLLSLYRYWNIIQYFYPNKGLIGKNWKDVLKEFVPRFINATDELAYKQAALALIASIHDTHANIWSNDQALKAYKGINSAPIKITFIEGKAVVTGISDKLSNDGKGLKIGDVIEKVDGRPVEEIIKEKLPFTPASNYETQLRDIATQLLRTNDTSLNINYTDGKQKMAIQVKCVGLGDLNLYLKSNGKDTCFKLARPDIAYIYPGTIKNTYLPDIMPSVLKTKGLIIDMRCYPSDFIVFSLGKYLMPQATDFVEFSNGSITTPGLFSFTSTVRVGETNKDFYKGKIVIIVNEQTQSQAEYTSMAFRVAPNATVIGGTTAGADGNISSFSLPGGLSTAISGIGVYYPDGRETQRVGIIPDVKLNPTIKGTKEGRDELLEKAIELINR